MRDSRYSNDENRILSPGFRAWGPKGQGGASPIIDGTEYIRKCTRAILHEHTSYCSNKKQGFCKMRLEVAIIIAMPPRRVRNGELAERHFTGGVLDVAFERTQAK